jgi:hypothetical protein
MRPLAVCSDRKSTARSQNTNEDISTIDLALPATTNVALLRDRMTQAAPTGRYGSSSRRSSVITLAELLRLSPDGACTAAALNIKATL